MTLLKCSPPLPAPGARMMDLLARASFARRRRRRGALMNDESDETELLKNRASHLNDVMIDQPSSADGRAQGKAMGSSAAEWSYRRIGPGAACEQ